MSPTEQAAQPSLTYGRPGFLLIFNTYLNSHNIKQRAANTNLDWMRSMDTFISWLLQDRGEKMADADDTFTLRELINPQTFTTYINSVLPSDTKRNNAVDARSIVLQLALELSVDPGLSDQDQSNLQTYIITLQNLCKLLVTRTRQRKKQATSRPAPQREQLTAEGRFGESAVFRPLVARFIRKFCNTHKEDLLRIKQGLATRAAKKRLPRAVREKLGAVMQVMICMDAKVGRDACIRALTLENGRDWLASCREGVTGENGILVVQQAKQSSTVPLSGFAAGLFTRDMLEFYMDIIRPVLVHGILLHLPPGSHYPSLSKTELERAHAKFSTYVTRTQTQTQTIAP